MLGRVAGYYTMTGALSPESLDPPVRIEQPGVLLQGETIRHPGNIVTDQPVQTRLV